MSLALRNNFGSKCSHSTLSQIFVIVLVNIQWFLDLIELFDGNVTSCLKTVGNLKWMDTLIEKLLGLFEDSSSQNDNTGCSISDFIILRCRELDKKPGSLMMDFHLFKDSGSIIGYNNLTVWRDKHFIHTLWSKGSLQETGNSSSGQNVDLVGLKTLDSLLLGLFSQNDEWAA